MITDTPNIWILPLNAEYNLDWRKTQGNGWYKQIQKEHFFHFSKMFCQNWSVSWENINFHRMASLWKHSCELKSIYVRFYQLTTIQLHSLPLKTSFYTSYTEDPTASHKQTLQILLQHDIQTTNLNFCLDFSLASCLSQGAPTTVQFLYCRF